MTNINLYIYLFLLCLYWFQVMSETKGIQKAEGYDCSDIWKRNSASTSGIYTIKPEGADASFQVFCEMTAAGGWTLMQRHNGEDGLSFDKMWADYEDGFGRLEGEHWLGLKHVHRLTHQEHRPSTLRISIGDYDGNEAYAQYSPFSVGDAKDLYRLSAGSYSGTAGDGFRGDIGTKGTNQNGSYFSTQDQPNDNCHPSCRFGDMMFVSCSDFYKVGWWYNDCGTANLNGDFYSPSNNIGWATSVSWPTWRPNEGLKYSKMYLIFN